MNNNYISLTDQSLLFFQVTVAGNTNSRNNDQRQNNS